MLTDAGIRHVIESDTEAAQVLKAVVEFGAEAELGTCPEVDAGTMCEVLDRGRRRCDKFFAKIDIETDAAVPLESTFAGAKGTDEWRHHP